MVEHYDRWLGGYLDDELPVRQQRLMETHLASCPECQAKLASMKKLSQLIQDEAIPSSFPSAEGFTRQVLLRLPPRTAPPLRRVALEASWWLTPFAIFAAWVFVQTVFLLSGWLGTADRLKLLGDAAIWLVPASPGATWLTSSIYQLGFLHDSTGLKIMQQIEVFSHSSIDRVSWQLSIALLYSAWLATWWAHHQKQPVHSREVLRLQEN